MKRITSNIHYILEVSVRYTGMIFAVLGFIGMFAPLDDLLGDQMGLIRKFEISCLILGGIWLIVFLASCVYVCRKKYYKLFDVGNGHHVYVQYGDIFTDCGLEDGQERTIVIPVNRCFDTMIDDDLISSRTLHGISMNQLYANHIFTQEELNQNIQRILADHHVKYELLEAQNKRKGNLKRYETGTVVEIPADDGITYFFLGLTSFDSDLHAHTEDDAYVLALIRLLMYNNRRSQGRPLYIPLIGAGAADTRKEERDILEYLVKLIKMNRKLVNCDLHIVVCDRVKESIPITNL